MLAICPDAVFESIGIMATQWASRYPYLQKSAKSKTRFDDFHRTSPRFYMTGNSGIEYSYTNSKKTHSMLRHVDVRIPHFHVCNNCRFWGFSVER